MKPTLTIRNIFRKNNKTYELHQARPGELWGLYRGIELVVTSGSRELLVEQKKRMEKSI